MRESERESEGEREREERERERERQIKRVELGRGMHHPCILFFMHFFISFFF